jgi:DeoR/GlpR family transcriptional regulator of sugar metabolism
MISLREAAELAGTSEVTARRDIRLLAESGLLRRTHGGAAAPSTSAPGAELRREGRRRRPRRSRSRWPRPS